MIAGWRQERIAKNQASFRDINERLERGLREVRDAPELLQFVCECGDRSCEELVSLTLDEYEGVRRNSRRFAIVPGHVFPDVERVVGRHDRYEVVEKFGDAVVTTDATDPRARKPAASGDGPHGSR